jgi:hypothetical protein
MTEEVQEDGSTVYYMHDKPTLAESRVVWKLTSLAFGISTDGGKTYPYGFTVNGEIVANLLYAVGIDATYIIANTITADKIDINSLSTEFATISSLVALEARVNYISADYADVGMVSAHGARIDRIESDYITTTELNAVSAKINYIDADYVSARTLGDDVVTAISGKAVYVQSLQASSLINADGGIVINGCDVSRKTATIGGVTINYWGWD